MMFINQVDGGYGRVLIADFSDGAPPLDARYQAGWGTSPLLNGWRLDPGDLAFVGRYAP